MVDNMTLAELVESLKTFMEQQKLFREQQDTRTSNLEEQIVALTAAVSRIEWSLSALTSKSLVPSFDGTEDPLRWLKQCKRFFANQKTPADAKVQLAVLHMTGEAQLWVDQLEQGGDKPTWETFKERCTMRFSPPLYNNPEGDLFRLEQTGSVAEYISAFQTLLAHTEDLTPWFQVNCFMAGLVPEIRFKVEYEKPINLDEAMSLARSVEKNGGPFLGSFRN